MAFHQDLQNFVLGVFVSYSTDWAKNCSVPKKHKMHSVSLCYSKDTVFCCGLICEVLAIWRSLVQLLKLFSYTLFSFCRGTLKSGFTQIHLLEVSIKCHLAKGHI